MTKLLSGRFLSTVMVAWTYCYIVCFAATSYVNSLQDKPEKMEAFVVGLVMGFSGLAGFILKSYFDRQDRKQEETTNVPNGA